MICPKCNKEVGENFIEHMVEIHDFDINVLIDKIFKDIYRERRKMKSYTINEKKIFKSYKRD